MSDPCSVPQHLPLSRLGKLGLFLLVLVLALFGALVEFRAAFLKRRMTDLDVYLRAAWAVRSGSDLYTITDDNDWHYHYPPLLAILLVPLADPPPGADRTGTLPFAVSVAVWYLFSVACLCYGLHCLASALERGQAASAIKGQPCGCRRWWDARVLPVLVCGLPIGSTLMRGQVNLVLLALLCLMVAALLCRKPIQAGFWLAGAISLKVIPAFLLLYALWRREGRFLAGCAVGLVLGLGVIPALALGPEQTLTSYRKWTDVLLLPALAAGTDQSRAKELIEVTATDSQSFLAVLHNTLHQERAQRPKQPSRVIRRTHWLLGGVLALVTLLIAGRRRGPSATDEVLSLGMLMVVMLLLSPVCHLHYFCLNTVLVMGMLVALWEREKPFGLGSAWTWLLATHLVASALPHLPGLSVVRDLGLAAYNALLLWLTAGLLLWHRSRAAARATPDAQVPVRLAA